MNMVIRTGALIALALATSTIAANSAEFGTPVKLGGVSTVSTSPTPGNGTGYNAVAGLTDGGHVVTWWGTRIIARRYNAAGAPIGADFDVATAGDYANLGQHSAVTGLDDGGFLVVWTAACQAPHPTNKTCAYGRRYNSAGVAGADFLINDRTQTTGSADTPFPVSLGNGGFAVVWAVEGASPAYRRFDAGSNPLDAEVLLSGVLSGSGPRAARLTTGGAVIVTSGPFSGHVFALRLNADGTQNGSQFQASTCCTAPTPDPEKTAPAVVGTSDGGFMISWSEALYDGSVWSGFVVARRYDASANPVTGVLQVAPILGSPYGIPGLAALLNGEVAIVWRSGIAPIATSALSGQRYDAAGNPIGRIIAIGPGNNLLPQYIAGLTGGRFVATWKTINTNGDGIIVAQRFRTTGAPRAVADRVSTVTGKPTVINVLANDRDPDETETLTVLTASALNGTVVINPDNTLTYTSGPTCPVSDTISYTIQDSTGLTSSSTVSVVLAQKGHLRVTPETGSTLTGPAGGPFGPAVTYRAANTGCLSLDWKSYSTVNWMRRVPSLGTLAPGAEVDVVISANANANGLPVGFNGGSLKLRDITNLTAPIVRPITLSITGP